MTTDTITIPADLAKRLKLCVDTVAGYFRFSPGQDGYQAVKELKEFVESIQPRVYIYPTPVEACRMIADAGGPIECEFGNDWRPATLTCIDVEDPDLSFRLVYTNKETMCRESDWVSKIRVLQPE